MQIWLSSQAGLHWNICPLDLSSRRWVIPGRYLAPNLPPAARCMSPSGHINSCCGQDVLFSSSGQLCMNKSHRWLGHPRGHEDKKKSKASKKQEKLLCLAKLSFWRKTNITQNCLRSRLCESKFVRSGWGMRRWLLRGEAKGSTCSWLGLQVETHLPCHQRWIQQH